MDEKLNDEIDEIKNKYKLIRVCWEDIFAFSRLSIEEIQENIDEYKIYKSEVGYLVHEDDDGVVCVHDLDLGNGSDNYGSYIPRAVIKSIEYLESAEEIADYEKKHVTFNKELKITSSRKYLRKTSEMINASPSSFNNIDHFTGKARLLIDLISDNNDSNIDESLKVIDQLIEIAIRQQYNELDSMMIDSLKHVRYLLSDSGQHFYIAKLACIHTLKQIIKTIEDNEKRELDQNNETRLKDSMRWFNRKDSDIKDMKEKYFNHNEDKE